MVRAPRRPIRTAWGTIAQSPRMSATSAASIATSVRTSLSRQQRPNSGLPHGA
jgi:hypothetical protein